MKQHKQLTETQWRKYSLAEQMANIGAEAGRAINWREKSEAKYSQAAFERSLELFDLTLAGLKDYPRLKEVARAREVWVDYYLGDNIYESTKQLWDSYFLAFNHLARSKCSR